MISLLNASVQNSSVSLISLLSSAWLKYIYYKCLEKEIKNSIFTYQYDRNFILVATGVKKP